MTTATEHDDRSPVDDRLIDRLVDGALSSTERRALLARLELEPEGWRRCALAFLESQAWAEALRPMAAPAGVRVRQRQEGDSWMARGPSSEPARSPAIDSRTETDQWHSASGAGPVSAAARARRLVAIAAGLLAAFTLGWAARGGRPEGQVARVVPARDDRVVSKPAPVRVVPAPTAPATRPVPSADPVVQRLESQGYQVERRRRLVSMETRDGRRLAVPVDEVRLRFVGDRTY
jgi:hypothetical protein